MGTLSLCHPPDLTPMLWGPHTSAIHQTSQATSPTIPCTFCGHSERVLVSCVCTQKCPVLPGHQPTAKALLAQPLLWHPGPMLCLRCSHFRPSLLWDTSYESHTQKGHTPVRAMSSNILISEAHPSDRHGQVPGSLCPFCSTSVTCPSERAPVSGRSSELPPACCGCSSSHPLSPAAPAIGSYLYLTFHIL